MKQKKLKKSDVGFAVAESLRKVGLESNRIYYDAGQVRAEFGSKEEAYKAAVFLLVKQIDTNVFFSPFKKVWITIGIL